MKILILLFAFLSIQLSAQSDSTEFERPNMTLQIGVSVPAGDFGATAGTKAGFANTGFSGIFEGSKIINEFLYWPVSIAITLNGINTEELEKLFPPGIDVGANPYFNTWLMTGLKFITPPSRGLGIYGTGQVGLLISNFPDITLHYQGSSITQTTSLALAFAFGFSAGMQIGDLNIGIRYYTANPEYKQSVVLNGGSFSESVKLPVSVMLIVIGLNI